ncbi:hypothetical protein MMC28_011770 [Mycoblastus sanguinarius]|nr:hypothetical protein [Mycoblastus sanguinarius]
MNRLRGLQQLDRIVVDECHVVLNEQWNFRRKLRDIGQINQLGVPIIALIVTLPPSRENELWKRFGWKREQIYMFRESTRRRNVAYQIRIIRQPGLVDVTAMSRHYRREHPDGKVVVYENTVRKVSEMASEFGCEAYHYHAVEKRQALASFQESETIITATSAFGMGIDTENIHADRPRTLLDYG